MPIENALKMLIEIFNRDRTQLMEDAADFNAIISMGITTILAGNQETMVLLTGFSQLSSIVMAIAQDKSHFSWDFPQEIGSWVTVSDIGRSEHGSQRKPHGCDNADDVQFPPIDPSMPTGLGPMGLRING